MSPITDRAPDPKVILGIPVLEGVLRVSGHQGRHPRRTRALSGNEAPESPDVSGAFSRGGYNLIRDPSGTTGFGATELTNTRAGLDPQGLKDNGGPTKTIALVQSGTAVDAVQEGCPPPAADQRGVGRPRNGDGNGAALYDIGSYELSAP